VQDSVKGGGKARRVPRLKINANIERRRQIISEI
jgi:hypothetical protein